MKRVYIASVKPLAQYVLQVNFISGSQLLLDLSGRIDSLRFRPLKNPIIWNSAATDGIFVQFGDTEISHDEILSMAEEIR